VRALVWVLRDGDVEHGDVEVLLPGEGERGGFVAGLSDGEAMSRQIQVHALAVERIIIHD
jgi:hypothetical protein